MIAHPGAEVLSAYLDGETSAEEHQRVGTHLSSCPECRHHLEELRVTADLVRGLPPVPAPVGFRQSVRAELQGLPALHRVLRQQWPPSWRVLAAATAIVLVGVFSVNLVRQLRPNGVVREVQERRSFESGGIAAPSPASPASKSVDNTARTASQPLDVPPSGRQVIRSASLITEVRDVDEAAKTLIRIAESTGGFVANSTMVHQRPSYGTVELRIPVTQFGRALEQVEGVGEVRERHISGQDVTEEFVDLQARIRNLERHEHQLLTFMDRAARVADLLAIEQELARVRGEIEHLTGRLRFIGNQVELATITVTLQEAARSTPGFWDLPASLEKVQAAFVNTVRQMLIIVERLVVLASSLVPLALLAFPTWILVRWFTRRRTRIVDEQSGQKRSYS